MTLQNRRRLYSYCEPTVDIEELVSIFGEKNSLVGGSEYMGSVHYCRPAWYTSTGEMGGYFYLRLITSVGGCWAITTSFVYYMF